MSDKPIRVLFRGWFNIPHSYSMVNCFQIVHLYKRYRNQIHFYVEEMPYFRQEWNASKKLVYGDEYNKIIQSFQVWKGEPIDLVYSITYPYDISEVAKSEVTKSEVSVTQTTVPKCVFYTSEFATLETTYFSSNPSFADDQAITEYIKTHENLYMTAPSAWSALGMKKYGLPDNRNRIITHGVDPTVFRFNNRNRRSVRDFYKVGDQDILLINIGSMTRNKGMMYIIQILNILVNRLGKGHYKLLLKGTGDLYQSKTFLEIYFSELRNGNAITEDEMNNLLTNHIIFTDKTLSYEKINDLFNAADLYFSPYLAEGFNLTSLEALAAGLPVMIPRTGSTREYMDDIYRNGGDDHIIYIDSTVSEDDRGYRQNNIDFENLLNLFLKSELRIQDLQRQRSTVGASGYQHMKRFIEREYSWDKVAELLYTYFKDIVSGRV